MSRRVRTTGLSTAPLIALVDDDLAVREALADLIEVLDLRCQPFDGGESFLARHVPGLFSCVVTDLNLLGLSGLELLERLTVLEPTLPVIVISARTDPDARGRALQSGAVAFLAKPIASQVLHRHLMWALSRGGPAA
jgi:FixJ family two-component response regulator